MPDYVAVSHTAYNWMITVYFFLGGLGAGAFLVSAIASYWKQEYKPFAKVASLIPPVAIGVGMLFLLVDLGKPFRFWRLFVEFNPTSALSWGFWFLSIFIVISLVHAWLTIQGKQSKAVAYVGSIFAVLVATYTGVLLSQSLGRALWHSALTPVLFLNGGLVSGIAATMLLSVGRQSRELLARLGRVAGWLLLVELGLIGIELLTLLNGHTEGVETAKVLLTGSFSFLFLGVEIGLGGVIPLLILLRGKGSTAALAVASVLVLVGIYTMRYVIITGGQVI